MLFRSTKEYQAFMKKFDVAPFYQDGAKTKTWLVDYVKALQEDLQHMAAKK